MKERGILFSAPMVRALLAGTKTQTRRIVKPQPSLHHYLQPMWGTSPPPNPVEFGEKWLWREAGPDYPDDASDNRHCPYGVPGDRLWVRETWAAQHDFDSFKPSEINWDARWHYLATEERGGLLWRTPIHMPRWASRITLEVTGVRVERVQDISEEDAKAEGVTLGELVDVLANGEPSKAVYFDARTAYAHLWCAINGADSWKANPWVWAISFRRVVP
jgi:hypothetical protein